MELSNPDGWAKAVRANRDRYGKAIIDYAERWANAMEREIAAGRDLADAAEQTRREADTQGISGFMYGAAVSTLSQVWVYGEQLRHWHNGKFLGGAEIGAAGGTANPAVLRVM